MPLPTQLPKLRSAKRAAEPVATPDETDGSGV
jgi:hypothetical protein